MSTTTHLHRCPECGHESWHEAAAGKFCANMAAADGGVAALLCDLCWGMRRSARVPAHEREAS